MTVRIGIAGIRGRMGREIATLAANDSRVELVGGLIRLSDHGVESRREALTPLPPSSAPSPVEPGEGGTTAGLMNGIPLFTRSADLLPGVDVLIDFSSPDGTVAHASECASTGVPLVCGTTGLDEAQKAVLRAAAEWVAVFHAANMSPGVNAVIAVLPALVRALQGYDIEIIEAHHRHKADAPSGTALALARVVADASGGSLEGRATYGRQGASQREPEEIGIHAIRGGGNPGEHAVILAGDGEEIRLSHRAFSRASYAEGALRAARLIVGQPPGWYDPATLPGFL